MAFCEALLLLRTSRLRRIPSVQQAIGIVAAELLEEIQQRKQLWVDATLRIGERMDRSRSQHRWPVIERETSSHRYEAVVRISEAIAACREPEELASTLADEIGDFLHFDHLYFAVLKENSKEIEYLVWGKASLP